LLPAFRRLVDRRLAGLRTAARIYFHAKSARINRAIRSQRERLHAFGSLAVAVEAATAWKTESFFNATGLRWGATDYRSSFIVRPARAPSALTKSRPAAKWR